MKIINPDIVPAINASFELSLPGSVSYEELKEKLTVYINQLINADFERLVYHLYRIDVKEEKMRQLLEQKDGENAAALIADLIIERLAEKIKSRQQFRQRDNNIGEDEKW
jgi:hypothetical protein